MLPNSHLGKTIMTQTGKILLLLMPISLLLAAQPELADTQNPSPLQVVEEDQLKEPWSRESVIRSVEAVDRARQKTVQTLEKSVARVLAARERYPKENNATIAIVDDKKGSTEKITESLAAGEIAKAVAYVEATKANAAAKITKAAASIEVARHTSLAEEGRGESLEDLKEKAMEEIAQAVASVEIAKAKAAQIIIKATESVELSKSKPAKTLAHPQEALSIAKDVSAVEVARAVSAVEIAKAVSAVEITESLAHIESSKPSDKGNTFHPATGSIPLEAVKAKAAASIAGSIAKVEVTKANAIAEIAHSVAAVKIAEIAENTRKLRNKENKARGNSTYPTVLIRLKIK
jgi:hypothetical protein